VTERRFGGARRGAAALAGSRVGLADPLVPLAAGDLIPACGGPREYDRIELHVSLGLVTSA
jgi:hypothetical protein